MRLITTKNLELRWFVDGDIPPYIILSHRWESDEVSYDEYDAWLKARAANPDVPEPQSAGFKKIKQFCHVCREDYYVSRAVRRGPKGFRRDRKFYVAENPPRRQTGGVRVVKDPLDDAPCQWAWIDTCCIDKRSSTELSEAINSMYRWYSNAALCLAYLCDISIERLDVGSYRGEVQKSMWFKRGWTLQELLAPGIVHIFDGNWKPFWSREQHADELAAITSIEKDYLQSISYDHEIGFHVDERRRKYRIVNAPSAVKLSWAAERMTTRVEDQSYCLFGLLGVNLPLLYGEGTRAFVRLQEEVIKHSLDHSLLLWRAEDRGYASSASAYSPAEFKHINEHISGLESPNGQFEAWQLDVHGLHISAPLISMTREVTLPNIKTPVRDKVRVAVLNLRTRDREHALGIMVEKALEHPGMYHRVHCGEIQAVPLKRLKGFILTKVPAMKICLTWTRG